jgi:hypothetical protein
MLLRITSIGKTRMTLQDWGSIGEILGAVAVLCSLIYLAVQIRQNTRSVEANTMQDLSEGYKGIYLTMATDPILAPIMLKQANGIELTEEEDFRLFAFQAVVWRATENMFFQAQRGTIDASYLDIRVKASGLFTENGYRRWQLIDGFTEDFVEYIERNFQQHGVGQTDA